MWSAAAVYQATRIFASNLNAKMAQRFYNLVLLPRIRDDITEYKRLNFHLYMALRKALFKPAAFFKALLKKNFGYYHLLDEIFLLQFYKLIILRTKSKRLLLRIVI